MSSNLDLNNISKDEIEKLFHIQSENVKKLNSASNENKLYLYKYYKQATVGNINIDPPGFFNFEAKEKYKAWKSVEDTSTIVAMKKYILKTYELL